MKTFFTKSFKKSYQKRIAQNRTLLKQFEDRYILFVSDPTISLLQDHPLSGEMKGYRSFSITGDIRVIYFVHEGALYFVDVGTHNQVY